jgi:3-hydroxyacyl-[acyl-carrier-protein] dehydratase
MAAGGGAVSRWTTLDRILEIDPEKGARALRNVPNTLAIFDSHFPRFPVLPGVLMLGSLAALAERLLQKKTGGPWQLARAEQVRFRHFVQPGDQVDLSVELKEFSPAAAVFSASARVDEKVVATVRRIRMVPRSTPETE